MPRPTSLHCLLALVLAGCSQQANGVLTFEDTEVAFGVLREGSTTTVSFQFSNDTDKPVSIVEVDAGCGCSAVTVLVGGCVSGYPVTVVPGQSGEVRVEILGTGMVRDKAVHVAVVSANGSVRSLYALGTFVTDYWTSPAEADIAVHESVESRTGAIQFEVQVHGLRPFAIDSVAGVPAWASLLESTPRLGLRSETHSLTFEVLPSHQVGRQYELVQFGIRGGRTVSMVFTAEFFRGVYVTAADGILGVIRTSSDRRREIAVRVGAELGVLEAETSTPDLEVSMVGSSGESRILRMDVVRTEPGILRGIVLFRDATGKKVGALTVSGLVRSER